MGWHDWGKGSDKLSVICAKSIDAPAPKLEECPKGWTTVENRCFKYDGTKRNFADSEKYCKSQGGNTASIHNNAENAAAIKLAKQTAFIGAESDGKGKWKWSDGSKWWQPKGTQHDGIVGKSETKIAISSSDKKWHDWGKGSDKLSVICALTIDAPAAKLEE